MKKDQKYDYILQRKFEDISIDYGVIKGNNTVVLIKVGQNGTIYGYMDKYLQISKNIHEKYGFTVVCTSNHWNGHNPLDVDLGVIHAVVKVPDKIYYMGHSNGGVIGLINATSYPEITRILSINAPIQPHKAKILKGLDIFKGEKLILVYGSLDPSYPDLDALKQKKNFDSYIIQGANHEFEGFLDTFINLPEKYLIP